MVKSIIAAALFTVAATAATAQPVNVGLEAGAYFANQSYRDRVFPGGTLKSSGDLKPGLRLGLAVEGRVSPGLWLHTGAFYIRKGASDARGADKIRVNYIQVPLYVVGKLGSLMTGRVSIGGGPWLAAAIDGSVKDRGVSVDLDFGNGPRDNFRRLDGGLGLTAAVEFPSRLYLRGNADFGLVNIRSNGNSDNRTRNWGLGISLGYRLL